METTLSFNNVWDIPFSIPEGVYIIRLSRTFTSTAKYQIIVDYEPLDSFPIAELSGWHFFDFFPWVWDSFNRDWLFYSVDQDKLWVYSANSQEWRIVGF